jgi:hypothetical protein
MIIKGKSHSGRGLGAYLLKDKNERVEVVGIRGDIPRDLIETLEDWRSASLGTNCTKPLYHAQINPDRELSPEEWNKAVAIFDKKMGFENQPRVEVEHEYKGRIHRHVIYLRIDENGKAISDSWNYVHHEQASREIERELGLEKTQGVFIDRDGERPERTPDFAALQQGERLKLDPKAVKAEVSAIYRSADTGRAFVAGLEDSGYILAQGDSRAYVILDPAGGVHSLSRAATVKAADLRETLKNYPLESLPTVDAARETILERQQERQQESHQKEQEQQAAAQKEQEQKPAAPAKEKPLSKTAGEIRLALSLTDSGQGFASALEDRGLTLFCVTEQDKVNSERNELAHLLDDQKKGVWYMERDGADKLNPQQLETAQDAYDKWKKRSLSNKSFANYVDFVQGAKEKRLNELLAAHGDKPVERPDAPHLQNKVEPGELWVMNDKGYVYALDERTTGKTRDEMDKYLAPVDRAPLMSGTDAYQAMQNAKDERFLTRQHEQRAELAERQRDERAELALKMGGAENERNTERQERQQQRHDSMTARLDAWQYEQRQRFEIKDPERDKAQASKAMKAAFGKAATEATKTPEPVRMVDFSVLNKPLALDGSVLAFHEHEIRQKADREPPARAAQRIEHTTAASFHAAAKVAGRAADTLADVADRFMTAAADFLVGATPPRVITEAEYMANEQARREWRAQQEAQKIKEEHRTAALDRMRETRIAGRKIDCGELSHLNYADLQNIKAGGEAALLELIRSREIEIERKRERERGGRER